MNKILKRFLILIFVVVVIVSLGYGGYKLYNYIVADITMRIKKGVTEGVKKGIIGGLNPFTWPGKIVGGED